MDSGSKMLAVGWWVVGGEWMLFDDGVCLVVSNSETTEHIGYN